MIPKPSPPLVITSVYCAELCNSNLCNSSTIHLLNRDIKDITANITIGFGKFVRNPENLPARILDLLQIAAYVYCADRLVDRGERTSINNNAWARSFEFHIPVFDIEFWSNSKVSSKMGEVLNVYENGITSINLPKQVDVINARASRTTHPKTLGLLREFFKLFDNKFDIKMPYYNQTKADILEVFRTYHEENIISSSVSCSSTRNKPKTASTHCGCCFRCVDRIFAAYASALDEYDVMYADDFINHIPNQETKQRLYNTLTS